MYNDYELPMLTTQQLTEIIKDNIAESARREQELYGQMSKWSNLYNEIQNQLYNQDKFVTDCIKDFSSIGGGVRYKDNSLNDLGKTVALLGIKAILPAIDDFIKTTNISLPQIEIYDNKKQTKISDTIKELFDRHGSDKSLYRNYHLFYAEVFERLGKNTPLNILEIGLGSQNLKIPSNMGTKFLVGASLKAYKEFFPNANIFGADIDKEILFTEDRIVTSYVDQLEVNTFEQMHKNFNCPIYDLVIEDGLHSFVASLHTLNFALKHTKKEGGIIILEDLCNINLWQMILKILICRGYQAQLIDSNGIALVIYL